MSGNVAPWPRPAPQSPSCFSELAQLGQCYNQVQWLTNLLTEIVTDIITTDTAVQQAIVDAIVATGSNVPLIGVTNGSDAAPGQVGEFVQTYQTLNLPDGQNTQNFSGMVLQPGDWDVWAWCYPTAWCDSLYFFLTNGAPPGFSNGIFGQVISGTSPPTSWTAAVVISPACRALISVPTLLPFTLITNAQSAQTAVFQLEARRRR
jgi:hypothetical protein